MARCFGLQSCFGQSRITLLRRLIVPESGSDGWPMFVRCFASCWMQSRCVVLQLPRSAGSVHSFTLALILLAPAIITRVVGGLVMSCTSRFEHSGSLPCHSNLRLQPAIASKAGCKQFAIAALRNVCFHSVHIMSVICVFRDSWLTASLLLHWVPLVGGLRNLHPKPSEGRLLASDNVGPKDPEQRVPQHKST